MFVSIEIVEIEIWGEGALFNFQMSGIAVGLDIVNKVQT